MQNIPYINMKFCTVGMLGLAVFLGFSDVGLARPKLLANSTYCDCSCVYDDGSGNVEYIWGPSTSCAENGSGCTKNGKHGHFKSCMKCTTDSKGDLYQCKDAITVLAPMPGTDALAPPTVLSPDLPGTRPPKGYEDIRLRGIDDAELDPPPGAVEPTPGEKAK